MPESTPIPGPKPRSHWGSRFGFVLAAAGSAVGLGNIWKFPYITGENGGGWFVLIYLACIALIGLPVMMAEIFIGRTAQNSPVGAFRTLSRPGSPWMSVGWLGVATAFVVLSFYSVVAGWSLHYAWLSIKGGFAGMTGDDVGALFGEGVSANATVSLFWHAVFMALVIAIVLGGVRHGVERAARILMPLLIIMMVALLIFAMTTDGFSRAFSFIFSPNADNLTAGGVLEALGHAFFTLSLGMGGMITYGSYLRQSDDLVTTSVMVSVLDTVVALMACLILFPIIFTFGMEPSAGPGLVFINLPLAFGQLPGGQLWAIVFFLLVAFAALTSGIALLEVAVSYFIDERNWSRSAATILCGVVIALVGVPSALSFGDGFFGKGLTESTKKSWFDWFDYISSNWMLPLGGLGIALFVAWRVGGEARKQGFMQGCRFANFYTGWLILLRYLVPLGILAVFLHAVGLI